MTIEEFQNDGELVAAWRNVLALPITKIVLELMEQQSRVHLEIRPEITSTYALCRMGHQSGWAEYEVVLTRTLIASPQKPNEHIEQTFEPEPDPEPSQE